MAIKALKINSNTYQIYVNLMVAGNQPFKPLSEMNNRFMVLRTVQRPMLLETRMEIWDEVDFRTAFRWVSGASEQGFTEVEEIERDPEDDTKWTPPPGDLGAV